jgi:hypothetical protein
MLTKNFERIAGIDLSHEDRAETGDHVELVAGRALEFRADLLQHRRDRSGGEDPDFGGIGGRDPMERDEQSEADRRGNASRCFHGRLRRERQSVASMTR